MFLQNKLIELKLDDEKDIPEEEEEKVIVDGVEIDESLYTVSRYFLNVIEHLRSLISYESTLKC